MKIGIGNDHAGTQLKNVIKEHLITKGYEVVDLGVNTEEPADYPKPAKEVGEAILRGEVEKGILICGTGIGISIAANKVPGIRAALCAESYSARMAVEHTDAHIVAMGARIIGVEVAVDIVDTFLNAKFLGGKYQCRIDMVTELDKSK